MFAAYDLGVVPVNTNRFSSLRVFGLGADKNDRFRLFSSSGPYVGLLSKPTRDRRPTQFCRLRLELDPGVTEVDEDTITIRAYWNLPTGWGLGGIDWQLNKVTGQIRPIKTPVYCKNFYCEPNEDR